MACPMDTEVDCTKTLSSYKRIFPAAISISLTLMCVLCMVTSKLTTLKHIFATLQECRRSILRMLWTLTTLGVCGCMIAGVAISISFLP